MARCLKPGGRLVLSEPGIKDHTWWLRALPDSDEVFERVREHRRSKFVNPLVGRALPRLVIDAGHDCRQAWATPILYTSLASARAAGGPFDRAVADAIADGVITDSEATVYIDALVEADRHGHFVFAASAVSVAATTASA